MSAPAEGGLSEGGLSEGGPAGAVTLFADGACSGNPGPGGWGTILRWGAAEREMSGGADDTTNNRMELMAVIAGLEALTRPVAVEIVTDSRYVVDGMTAWMAGWVKRGWRAADGKPVKNVDLWQRLAAAAAPHRARWTWVRGHSGHAENERCDALARAAVPRRG